MSAVHGEPADNESGGVIGAAVLGGCMLGFIAGVLLSAGAQGALAGHGIRLADLLRAAGDLLRSVAWPFVALLLVYSFREPIGKLIPRLSKLGGVAEFGPQPQQTPDLNAGISLDILKQPVPAAADAIPAPAQSGGSAAAVAAPALAGQPELPAGLQQLRTAEVLKAENAILSSDPLKGIVDPALKARALSTIAAALFIDLLFESVDGAIWGSQLQLLQALSVSSSLSRDAIRINYYDKAKASFPAWFTNYSFEQYLHFLGSWNLVTDIAASSIAITDVGRDYLVWRVRKGRPMKALG